VLKSYHRWSIDGTFFSAPKGAEQVYVIGVLLGPRFSPCVYMLLPGKSQEIYEKAFEAVFSEFTIEQTPTSVMMG
jgi:hypothetical protein